MHKHRFIEMIDSLTSTDNHIKLSEPDMSENKASSLSPQDCQELLAHLLFLALPSPSQHVH